MRQLSLTHYQLRDFIMSHCAGRAAAMTAERIALATGISTRQQQKIISDLRDRGVIICSACSSPMGYYWPSTLAEQEPFVRQLEKRVAAGAAALAIIYRQTPAHRPERKLRPPMRHHNRGEQVTAQMILEVGM